MKKTNLDIQHLDVALRKDCQYRVTEAKKEMPTPLNQEHHSTKGEERQTKKKKLKLGGMIRNKTITVAPGLPWK